MALVAPITGTFTGTGSSGSAIPERGATANGAAPFNVSLWGTFSATVQLERSFDGALWLPITARGSPISFTAPCTEVFEEPEDGVLYRLTCTAYTSGTVNYRISQ